MFEIGLDDITENMIENRLKKFGTNRTVMFIIFGFGAILDPQSGHHLPIKQDPLFYMIKSK